MTDAQERSHCTTTDPYTPAEHARAAERLCADLGITVEELDRALANWHQRQIDLAKARDSAPLVRLGPGGDYVRDH